MWVDVLCFCQQISRLRNLIVWKSCRNVAISTIRLDDYQDISYSLSNHSALLQLPSSRSLRPARRTNVFILAKKFQSSPKPNVLDKFFYSAYSTRFRGSSEQGSSWADPMSPSPRSKQVWREATRYPRMRKSTRSRRRRGRENWLCCSQVYTANLALMSLSLSLRVPFDLPNNDTTPLWGTYWMRNVCHVQIHDMHTLLHMYTCERLFLFYILQMEI